LLQQFLTAKTMCITAVTRRTAHCCSC